MLYHRLFLSFGIVFLSLSSLWSCDGGNQRNPSSRDDISRDTTASQLELEPRSGEVATNSSNELLPDSFSTRSENLLGGKYSFDNSNPFSSNGSPPKIKLDSYDNSGLGGISIDSLKSGSGPNVREGRLAAESAPVPATRTGTVR